MKAKMRAFQRAKGHHLIQNQLTLPSNCGIRSIARFPKSADFIFIHNIFMPITLIFDAI
jgi:hypothetical protein